jgi:hypothetical protein
MSEKRTKQGVRDLSHLKAKPAGVRLSEPPVPVACRHKNTRVVRCVGISLVLCDDCSETVYEY